ncbi:MAG TPA: EamA family transporter [Candidatus Sulfomarinibacteraceae bacterium]|nr:EamA family transporter [Candidatus Sulfomarinibacteraceae bacterium]
MSQTASDRSPDRRTLLAFAGVVLFGGLNGLGVKQTVQELAPFWGASLRFLAAGLILLVIVRASGRSMPGGRSLAGALLYGAIGFAASYGLIYQGLRELSAGTTQVLIALTPLLTFGLAIVHRQERFRAWGLAGALIALAGVALVVADQLSVDMPPGSLVLVVLGAVCIAETGVIIKWIPKSDPFATNAVAMLTGAALLVGLSFVTGETHALPSRPATWAALGYLVVFGSVLMFALYLFALQRWTASAVSYTTLLLPLVTVSTGALVAEERVSALLLVGGSVVLVGVYVGAFLKGRPARSSASSLPECLPVDAQASQAH